MQAPPAISPRGSPHQERLQHTFDPRERKHLEPTLCTRVATPRYITRTAYAIQFPPVPFLVRPLAPRASIPHRHTARGREDQPAHRWPRKNPTNTSIFLVLLQNKKCSARTRLSAGPPLFSEAQQAEYARPSGAPRRPVLHVVLRGRSRHTHAAMTWLASPLAAPTSVRGIPLASYASVAVSPSSLASPPPPPSRAFSSSSMSPLPPRNSPVFWRSVSG